MGGQNFWPLGPKASGPGRGPQRGVVRGRPFRPRGMVRKPAVGSGQRVGSCGPDGRWTGLAKDFNFGVWAVFGRVHVIVADGIERPGPAVNGRAFSGNAVACGPYRFAKNLLHDASIAGGDDPARVYISRCECARIDMAWPALWVQSSRMVSSLDRWAGIFARTASACAVVHVRNPAPDFMPSLPSATRCCR